MLSYMSTYTGTETDLLARIADLKATFTSMNNLAEELRTKTQERLADGIAITDGMLADLAKAGTIQSIFYNLPNYIDRMLDEGKDAAEILKELEDHFDPYAVTWMPNSTSPFDLAMQHQAHYLRLRAAAYIAGRAYSIL